MFLRSVASVLLGFCLCVSPASFAQGTVADEQSAGNALTNDEASVTKASPDSPTNFQQRAIANVEATTDVQVGATREDKAPQWVWGEVVSVDQANKQLVIKHLDYETYEEIQTTLRADDKTIFENIGGLSDIRPKDHITVDYNTLDNVNIAELLVVDKEQAMTTDEPIPAQVKQ